MLKKLKKITDYNDLNCIECNELTNDTDFELLSSKINELTLLLNEKVTSLSNEKEYGKSSIEFRNNL